MTKKETENIIIFPIIDIFIGFITGFFEFIKDCKKASKFVKIIVILPYLIFSDWMIFGAILSMYFYLISLIPLILICFTITGVIHGGYVWVQIDEMN